LTINESSEEKKQNQGHGSSSGSYSQTSNEEAYETIQDLTKQLNTLQVWKDIE
jgi:hypothetical protein